MIKQIYKSITTVESGIIAHGVNCQRAMGSGVALAIKNKWPMIYDAYMESPTGLGDTDFVEVGDHLYVANCYTQDFYGNDNKMYASVDAILSSLTKVYNFAVTYALSVNLPKIGSDRGGLDWDTDVLPIITTLDDDYSTITTNLYIWK